MSGIFSPAQALFGQEFPKEDYADPHVLIVGPSGRAV